MDNLVVEKVFLMLAKDHPNLLRHLLTIITQNGDMPDEAIPQNNVVKVFVDEMVKPAMVLMVSPDFGGCGWKNESKLIKLHSELAGCSKKESREYLCYGEFPKPVLTYTKQAYNDHFEDCYLFENLGIFCWFEEYGLTYNSQDCKFIRG